MLPLHPSWSPVVFLRVLSFHLLSFFSFINDLLHATASDVHSFADDSTLHKSSFQCQPSSNARSHSRLAMSSTINSDLQSISEWGTRNLVKFNTSKTQLLTPRRWGLISHTYLWGGGFQRYRKSFKIGHKPFYSQVSDKEW